MAVHMLPGAGYDCNIFIVTGNHPVVVDAGTGERHARTVERITKVVGDRRVQAIVLTHRHFDHVGGAAALSVALDAPVYAHEEDAGPLQQGSAKGTEAIMFSQRMDKVDVRPLKGGETFSTGEHDLRVVHTPGHTTGGISLYDKEKRILISGDTVFAGGVGRWDLATGDREELVVSIRSLLALAPVDLYPGHGPAAIGDASQQIEGALRILGEY
jgi:hydroxyacylglutathione hydrolase